MTENWIEKIQQDAELQMLVGLTGGGLVLFVVLLIVIVVRLNNRKRKQAASPLGEIRIQSTHTPEIVEETKEHLVFRNKVSNETSTIIPDRDQEPEPIRVVPNSPALEITPTIPEPSADVPAVSSESYLDLKLDVIPSLPPIVVPPSGSEKLSEEEKKKEILKAIEETRSREENLRIIQDRLRELRGETMVEIIPPAAETKFSEETSAKLPEEHTNSIQIESLPEVKQNESAETVVESAKSYFEFSDQSEIAEVKQEIVSESTERDVEVSQSVTEHLDISKEEPEVASFVQETILPVPEPEVVKHTPVSTSASDSPKTFTEWLSTLSGKKR